MAQASPSPDPPVTPELWSFRREYNRELPGFSPALDSQQVLADLRKTVRDGRFSLDAILQHIAEAAQTLTCADGAAIAIRRDDSIICRARAGKMAPELGTRLDTDSGISGRCLRMGVAMRCYDTNDDTRVDARVCHGLGISSLAVVPVGRKPTVAGILEAFSALPDDFVDSDMRVLEQLAELVIAARRRWPELPAHRLEEKVNNQTPQNWSKRNLLLAAPTVLVLVVWLLFRSGPKEPQFSATPVQLVGQSVASPVATSAAGLVKPDRPPALRVWLKPSGVRSEVVMASKAEKAGFREDRIVRNIMADPGSNSNHAPNGPESLTPPTPPVLAAGASSSETALEGLLSAPVPLLAASTRVSQGLSGGTIERQVNPVYPAEALALRLEGRVRLQAIVTEDGMLSDLKVLDGDPRLARAAMEAVSKWRYRPYRLNGEPIRKTTEISLIFKLP